MLPLCAHQAFGLLCVVQVDDAVSVECFEADGAALSRLWVHVADASRYVARGSPLDVEARARSTSICACSRIEPSRWLLSVTPATSLLAERDTSGHK